MSSQWSSMRFRRSHVVSRHFVLEGIPAAKLEAVQRRLGVLGVVFIACGRCFDRSLLWLEFRCSASVAGSIALVVPCEGTAPLWVSKSGRLLYGAAEAKARLARGGRGSLLVAVQAETGRRCWA
jgi:hypothetical protein